MHVVRLCLLTLCGLFMLMAISPRAQAAECWNLSPAAFSFGTVTGGETARANASLQYSCNNYESTPKYVRLCLNLTSVSVPQMHTNPPVTPLNYLVYQASDLSNNLGYDSGSYYQQTLYLGPAQTNYTFDFDLAAIIPAGQTGLTAGDYFDYGTDITIKYTESDTVDGLPSCPAMAGTVVADRISSTATIKNGCDLLSVAPMDFGSKSPVNGGQLAGDAAAGVAIRCPVNTTFTVAIGPGVNNDGTSRRVCNGANCVAYGLYQDAGHTTPWNDSDAVQTQTATTGDAQTLTVYGMIPAQSWPTPGTYTDTVVVTLSY
ncbi:Csu type fimbrial protein [Intestinirhabdus alba]|jgi:spore coat protein U-like protein|uniref:Fimbrial major subunit CsuA/B family protein n=1 Tax=Intestinirhabdus alba TaxID=2899544 RepID=A0A6L6IGC2_9ENTR|nr:spore coat U domain-containing protein [Intestinirhabdus alba]MTH44698.1 fimbrial major subunit CsuA/B family protein [Intestinirhabdus alba]